MTVFRTLWLVHRWLGVAAGLVLMLTAATGFLLLQKKSNDWLQPTVVRGASGPPEQLKPLIDVYNAVFALGLPEFRSEADIARVDFRPAQRVHKVVSEHGDLEVQVCGITLRTSGPKPRRSDWLERLHDGSFWCDAVHGWVMPAAALVLLYLASSGYVMWLWPKWQKWRRRRQV
ncbi:MAG TPA: PepSY-associated TM helix domain-containing protein [Planctomycetota bacterium]